MYKYVFIYLYVYRYTYFFTPWFFMSFTIFLSMYSCITQIIFFSPKEDSKGIPGGGGKGLPRICGEKRIPWGAVLELWS